MYHQMDIILEKKNSLRQYKIQERADLEALKEIALSDKHDSIAKARRLSQETNKRRKTMAQKRKAMAQREEKRRQEILAQRREEQSKATEKYQRSNLGSARHRKRSPRHQFYLEDTLRLIRGSSAGSSKRVPSPKSPGKSSSPLDSSGNTDPMNKAYFPQYHSRHMSPTSADRTKECAREHREMLDSSLRNFNNSRNLFQQQLEQHQQLLLAEQEKSLRHFNEEIQQEMERDVEIQGMRGMGDEIPRSPSVSSLDSLEQSLNSSSKLSSHTPPHTQSQQPTDPASQQHFTSQSQFSTHTYMQPPSQSLQPVPQTLSSYAPGYQAQTAVSSAYQQQQAFSTSVSAQQQQQAFLTAAQQQQGYPGTAQVQQVYSTLSQPQRQEVTVAPEQGHVGSGGVTSVLRFVPDVAQVVPKSRPTQSSFWNGEAHPYTRPEYHNHLIGPIARPSSTVQHLPAQEQLFPDGEISSAGALHGRSQSARPAGYGGSTSSGQPVSGTQTHAVSGVNVMVNHHLAWTTPQPSPSSQASGVMFPDPNVTLPSREAPSYVSSQAGSQPAVMVRSTAGVYSVGMSRPNAAVGSKTPHVPASTSTVSASQYQQQLQKNSAGRYGEHNAAGDAGNLSGVGDHVLSPRSNTESGRHHMSSFGLGDGGVSNKENQNTGNIPVSDANLTQGTLALVKGRLVTLPPNINNNTQKQDPVPDSKPTEDKITKHPPTNTRYHSTSDLLASKGTEKKGILKRPGGSGTMTKAASVSALNQTTVKDSIELARTQYHVQGGKAQTRKKSVRWTDLHYDDNSSDSDSDNSMEGSKPRHNQQQSGRGGRPMSAKPSSRGGGGGGRARSASAGASRPPLQPSTPTHASNRPKAAAHIITHSMDAMELAGKTYAALQAQLQGGAGQDSKVAINSRAAGGIVAMTNASTPGKTSTQSGLDTNGDLSHPASSTQQPQSAVRLQQAPIYTENGLRIDRTPTDEEINYLWDKVRTCLSRTAPGTTGPEAGKKNSLVDMSRTSAPMSHKYIDGATLALGSGKSNLSAASTYSQPNSYPNRGAKPASANSNTYLRRYGLLQQRRAQSARQPATRPLAAPSNHEPQHSSAYLPQEDVSESMAGFMVAEQLAAQSNVGDSQIQAAIEEAQSRQNSYNTAHPAKKIPSALSMEEQRILESLDRLNEELKTCEAKQGVVPPGAIQPPPQQPAPAPQSAGYRGHGPRIIQRRTLSGGVTAPMRVNNQPQTYR